MIVNGDITFFPSTIMININIFDSWRLKSNDCFRPVSYTHLASKLGTISAGATSSAAIANVMNSYKTTFRLKQSYTATNVLDKTSPSAFFSSALKSQIKGAYTAPIILIDTGHDSGTVSYTHLKSSCSSSRKYKRFVLQIMILLLHFDYYNIILY